MAPPKYTEIAFNNLASHVQMAASAFAQNYADPTRHAQLTQSIDGYIPTLTKEFKALAGGVLDPAIRVPAGSFANFVSSWNNGAPKSWQACEQILDQLNRQIIAAKPQVQTLLNSAGAAGPHNSPDAAVVQVLAKDAVALQELFNKAQNNAALAKQLPAAIAAVNAALHDTRYVATRAQDLTRLKSLWQQFESSNPTKLSRASLTELASFVAQVKMLK